LYLDVNILYRVGVAATVVVDVVRGGVVVVVVVLVVVVVVAIVVIMGITLMVHNLGDANVQANIVKVRDAGAQMDLGVPPQYLDGHAWHTYRLTSGDGTVAFEFQHNVNGRQIYAEGTVDAALFLAKMVAAGSSQKVFNMVDVLKAGAMR
jgi:dihydrodipicolinate reductase